MTDSKLLSTINTVGHLNTDKDVKKVAIQKEGYFPVLYDIKPTFTIEDIVKEICQKWSLSKAENYALQYIDTKVYVTDENREDIRDGVIFTITYNVEITVANFLTDIEQPDLATKRKALQNLAGTNEGPGQSDDPLFAREFIKRNGINTLKNIIESPIEPGDIVASAMSAIQDLQEHQFTTWEGSVAQIFIEKLIEYANRTDGTAMNVVQKALSLLDNIVTNSSTYYITIINKIKPTNLVQHLSADNESVQLSTMSLCNSIMFRMEHENRKKFSHDLVEKGYLGALRSIVSHSSIKPLLNGMSHQLYVYQWLIIGLHEQRMSSKPDFDDPKLLTDLNKIYDIAFDSTPSGKDKGSGKADFLRLGFQYGGAPLIDFEECPPGILAYDVIMHFVEHHHDQYIKIILENFGRDPEYECPFGKCAKNLTKILCELLEVGSTMSDTCVEYQPIIFSTPCILEELFCVSIQLLNKTWKEMRATLQDFPRVIGVVRDQLKRVLSKRPDTIEKFKSEAFSLNYQVILRLMQQEAHERNILDFQKKPVMELRERIEPEIRELVREQRLAQLVEGSFFSLLSTRGKVKNQHRFCCLSPNHRFLHYGDVESNTEDREKIAPDSLPNKIPVSEITRIETGKDVPNAKNLKRGFINMVFSIFYAQEEHIDFISPDEDTFGVWTDALSLLIGEEAVSDKFKEDLEMLLNMEMKLLLLDLENVNLPDDAPLEIPPEPDNYNFYYQAD